MADAIGFASAIAGLAAFGIQIVTTLNTFVTTYSNAEQQIKDLSASVALTTSILESIGKEIKAYEDQCQLTVDKYIAVSDMCEKNFNSLWVALKVVKKEKGEKPQVKAELRIGGRMSVWAKISHAVGGADALKDLVLSIETSKSNLQLLLSSLQFSVLRGLRKGNLLTEDQSDDLKLFTSRIPELFLALQKAGFIRVEGEKKKPMENAETNSVNPKMHDGNISLAARNLELSSNNTSSGNNQNLPSNIEKAGRQGATTTSTQVKENSKVPEQSELHLPPPLSPRSLPEGTGTAVTKEINVEEVVRSGEIAMSSLDTESIYEGWLIKTKPRKDPDPDDVMAFCGMRLSIYRDLPKNSFKSTSDYSVTPFSKDKEMLRDRASSSKTRILSTAVEVNNDKDMVKDLPKKARREAFKLLNDRNRRARPPHGWKIVALVEQTRKPNFWSPPWKSRSPTRWLMIIRGAVIEPHLETRRKRNMDLPRRHDDPWRQAPGSQALTVSDSEYYSTDSDSEDSSTFRSASESTGFRARYRGNASIHKAVTHARMRNPKTWGYVRRRKHTRSREPSERGSIDHMPIAWEGLSRRRIVGSGERIVFDNKKWETIDDEKKGKTVDDEEEEIIDDEEVGRLMDKYLASFMKYDGKETEEEKRKENSI